MQTNTHYYETLKNICQWFLQVIVIYYYVGRKPEIHVLIRKPHQDQGYSIGHRLLIQKVKFFFTYFCCCDIVLSNLIFW